MNRAMPSLDAALSLMLLGLRTSRMGKQRFSEWLEFLHATAALRGVVVYADEAA